jgi:KDO2-lipid IV(A) lauroyltransferase
MKNKIEYFLFLSLSKIVCYLGIYKARRFALFLAILFYYVIPIRKKVAINNLKLAFKDKSEKEIRKIAFGSYKSFAIALIEILCIPSLTQDDISKLISCHNFNLVTEKYNLGRGLIILSAHFSNWEFGALIGSIKTGIPFNVVVKQQRNNLVDAWMNKARTKWNNNVIPLGVSIKQVYQALKQKKIVAMIADQRGPADGVRVNMFGIPSSVYIGPAVLSLKNNIPIIMGISVRQNDNSYNLSIEEVNLENLPEKHEDKILEICQRHTSILENYIKKNPEQWFWMHKRWKY